VTRVVQPRCPLRPGQPCTLCHPGATGPADCGAVWLVMHDPELRDGVLGQGGRPVPDRRRTGA